MEEAEDLPDILEHVHIRFSWPLLPDASEYFAPLANIQTLGRYLW